jgi:hypothetical protein
MARAAIAAVKEEIARYAGCRAEDVTIEGEVAAAPGLDCPVAEVGLVSEMDAAPDAAWLSFRIDGIRITAGGHQVHMGFDRPGQLAVLGACERYAAAVAVRFGTEKKLDAWLAEDVAKAVCAMRDLLRVTLRIPDALALLGTLQQILAMSKDPRTRDLSLHEALGKTHDGAVVTSLRTVIEAYVLYAQSK